MGGEGEREIWDLALASLGANALRAALADRLLTYGGLDGPRFIILIGEQHVSAAALQIIRDIAPGLVIGNNFFGPGTVTILEDTRHFLNNAALQLIPLELLPGFLLERRLALDLGL